MTDDLFLLNKRIQEYVSVPVIVTQDPFVAGRLRVFSTIANTCILDMHLRSLVPQGIDWDHNNPQDLFRDFVLASENGLKVIKIARQWRTMARLSAAIMIAEVVAFMTIVYMYWVGK